MIFVVVASSSWWHQRLLAAVASTDMAPIWPRESKYMSKKTVEFDAHKTVKQEKEISFTKKDGTPVDFEAKVPTKVPVHAKFKADPDKKR